MKLVASLFIVCFVVFSAGCAFIPLSPKNEEVTDYSSLVEGSPVDGGISILPVAVVNGKKFQEENARKDHNVLDLEFLRIARKKFPDNTVVPIPRAAFNEDAWEKYEGLVKKLSTPKDYNSKTDKKILGSLLELVQDRLDIELGHLLVVIVNSDKNSFAESSKLDGVTAVLDLKNISLLHATTTEHEYDSLTSVKEFYPMAVSKLIDGSVGRIKEKVSVDDEVAVSKAESDS